MSIKMLIVYSSRTGNTKMVADAIREELGGDAGFYPMKEAPSPDAYDLLIIGFWVNRGTADPSTLKYIENIRNKRIVLFATLGAYPDSDHAGKSMESVVEVLEGENEILGTFMCQGKIDPRLLEKYKTSQVMNKNHPMTSERRARHAEAAKHPDEKDLKEVRTFISDIMILQK